MFFKEVIGHEKIKQHLLHSIQTKRVSHAMLLSGDTGSGSLALALAFTQYLFCTGDKHEEACGQCPACQKMKKLIHPDLHFIFPVVKSENIKIPTSDDYLSEWRNTLLQSPYLNLNDWLNSMGVDENKQASIYSTESNSILHKLTLKSFESNYKIMIIWLPEKMETECANKLLKILEEPYPNTIFLLVSENPENMLKTILSRTQRINIPPLNQTDITQKLVQCYNLQEKTAQEIAHVASGNWSKAQKIVEETEDTNYNQEKFIQMMRLCWERKMLRVNEFVNEITSLKREKQKNFLQHCIRMTRENFVKNFGIEKLVYMTAKEQQFSVKFSPYIHEGNVIPLYDEFEKAYSDVVRNGNGKIIFTDLCIKVMQNIRP